MKRPRSRLPAWEASVTSTPSPFQCGSSLKIDIRSGAGGPELSQRSSARTSDALRDLSFFKYLPELPPGGSARSRTEERNLQKQHSNQIRGHERRCAAALTHVDSCPGGHCQRLITTPTLGLSVSMRTISVAALASHTRFSGFFSLRGRHCSWKVTLRTDSHDTGAAFYFIFSKGTALGHFSLPPQGHTTDNPVYFSLFFFLFILVIKMSRVKVMIHSRGGGGGRN